MSGLYFHIPFCKQRCIYCDFYSTVNGRVADRYINATLRELEMRAGEIDLSTFTTLYIGGGTPSLLNVRQLSDLVSGIGDKINLGRLQELTIELNPEDVTPVYASVLLSLGFNRVSMGAQSFDDNELRLINRRHSSAKIVEAYEVLCRAGFENLNLDLMYGLPGQDLGSFGRSVDRILELRPQHISAYSLMVVEGTPIYRMRECGNFTEVSDEEYSEMYDLMTEKLCNAGYDHYEISNFSLPGYHSLHNCSYWNMVPYLGIGASAHSWDGRVRRYNPDDLKVYIESLEGGVLPSVVEEETLSERFNDYILTSLRTKWGADCGVVRTEFGEAFACYFTETIGRYARNGMVQHTGNSYRIADESMMMSDAIIRDLIYVD